MHWVTLKSQPTPTYKIMKTSHGFFGAPVRTAGAVFLAVVALGLQIPDARAQLVTLAPGDNSSLQVNTSGANAGAVNWIVDGNNILNPVANGLQWFFYSVGAGTPAGIQQIGPPVSTAVTSLTPDSSSFGSTYTDGAFSLQAVYTLTGGPVGSGNSDLQETITVQNTSAGALNFHFFQYANFTIPNSTVSLYPINARGTPLYYLAQVNGGGISLSEYVDGTLNPGANGGTITPPTLLSLTTTPGYQVPPGVVPVSGPGGSWLLEWDPTIQPNTSFTLSKDIDVTGITPAPEPAALSLFAFGLIGFCAFSFLRRRAAD
jgi:hypothetical protein